MKKLNKLVAILVAMAMVLSLSIIAAFADDPAPATAKNFKLTKTLKMPDGTTIPDNTFSFTVEPVEGATAASTPAATAPSFNFKNENAGAADATGTVAVSGEKTAAQIFTGTYAAGKYVYLIKEVNEQEAKSIDGAHYTYDTTEYKVFIYVDKDGNKTYTLAVKAPGETEFTKDTAEGTGDNATYVADFNNEYYYTKNNNPDGGDPTDPTNTDPDTEGFAIEKFITKDDSNLYDGTPFTMNVKVSKPALSKATSYAYEVVNVGETDSTKLVAKTGTITPDAEDATQITITKGQRIVFKDLDVGAKVFVTETDTADFNDTSCSGDLPPKIIPILSI